MKNTDMTEAVSSKISHQSSLCVTKNVYLFAKASQQIGRLQREFEVV
jgi:hypothetical protein